MEPASSPPPGWSWDPDLSQSVYSKPVMRLGWACDPIWAFSFFYNCLKNIYFSENEFGRKEIWSLDKEKNWGHFPIEVIPKGKSTKRKIQLRKRKKPCPENHLNWIQWYPNLFLEIFSSISQYILILISVSPFELGFSCLRVGNRFIYLCLPSIYRTMLGTLAKNRVPS